MKYIFIFGAKYAFVLPILLWAWYLWRLRQERNSLIKLSLMLLATMALTYLLGLIAKHLYYDPRPFIVEGFKPLIPHIPDNGFPSDHALLVGALAAASLFTNNRKLAIYAWILAVFVAYSRVYVGVHHPVDVMASIAFALLSAFAVHLVLARRLDAIIVR